MNISVFRPMVLDSGYGFEAIVSQMQPYSDKILSVRDGTYLDIYDESSVYPSLIKLELKQRRNNVTEYYFRDQETDSLFCFFGRKAAETINPNLSSEDPVDQEDYIPVMEKTEGNLLDLPNSKEKQPEKKIEEKDSLPLREKPIREKPIRENPIQENPIQEKPIQENPIQENPIQEEIPILAQPNSDVLHLPELSDLPIIETIFTP